MIRNRVNDTGSILLSRLHLGKLLDIGVVECELTDDFSNPVIFQCGLEKKSLHMKSRKHKEAFWLTNLVRFRFSSCGESWKITSGKRLWVAHRRKLCMHTWLRVFCSLPWILAQPLMDKIKTYWLLFQELETKLFCATFRFMTSQFSPRLEDECRPSLHTYMKPDNFWGLLCAVYDRDHLKCSFNNSFIEV